MAISIVETSTSTSGTLTRTGGKLKPYDVIFVGCTASQNDVLSFSNSSFTTLLDQSVGTNHQVLLLYKVVADVTTEPLNYTFTAAGITKSAVLFVLRGIANPWDLLPVSVQSSANDAIDSTTNTPPSLSLADGDTWAISIIGGRPSVDTTNVTSGWTPLVGKSSSGNGIIVEYNKLSSSEENTVPPTYTGLGVASDTTTFTFTIQSRAYYYSEVPASTFTTTLSGDTNNGTFWADGFWAPGFWADGFWASAVQGASTLNSDAVDGVGYYEIDDRTGFNLYPHWHPLSKAKEDGYGWRTTKGDSRHPQEFVKSRGNDRAIGPQFAEPDDSFVSTSVSPEDL